jgi:hypothetical protein
MADEIVLAFLKRIEGMWPILKKNDEHKEAIVLLVSEKAANAKPKDFDRAFRMLVQNCPTSNKDGGPAWPPNPNEILGILLSAMRDGSTNTKVRIPYHGPRKIAGRLCRKCSNGLTLFENVMYCQTCKSVQAIEGDRTQLTPHEIHTLEFTDSSDVDYDEAEDAKAEALEKVRALLNGRKK